LMLVLEKNTEMFAAVWGTPWFVAGRSQKGRSAG
jgi:hypothetical protein